MTQEEFEAIKADWIGWSNTPEAVTINKLLAEVERLTQYAADCNALLIIEAKKAKEAKAENARLREALEKIVDPENWSENWFDPGIVRIAVDALEGSMQSTCKWEHDLDGEDDVWETECDNAFLFEIATPQEHGYRFCPCCGKPIQFVEIEEGGEG